MNQVALIISLALYTLGAFLVWSGLHDATNRLRLRDRDEGICAVGLGLFLIGLAVVVFWRGM